MDSTTKAQVEVLIFKAKNVASKIYNIVLKGRSAKTDEAAKFVFKGMVKELKSHYDSFTAFNNEIIEYYVLSDTHDTYPSQEFRKIIDDTDRYYYESLAIAESLSPAVLPTDPMLQQSSSSSGSCRMMRASLPPIKLHQFDGTLSLWPLFKDQFQSVVHSDKSLPRVEKFNLLISNLIGVPLSLIKGIPITDDTYQQAWDILLDHYDSKRIMANYYLQQILKCKQYTGKPTVSSQKKFITEVCENINALKKLQIPNLAEFILFTLAVRCLDETTRHNFEKDNVNVEFPTFDALFQFVKRDCRTRELCGMSYEDSSLNSSSQNATNNRPQSKKSFFVADRQFNGRPSNKLPSKHSPANSSKCPGCNSIANHTLHRCIKFRSCSPREKLDLLKGWSGCRNCLSSNHSTKGCPSNTNCRDCDKRHNTWLHLDQSAKLDESPISPSSDQQGTSSTPASTPALIGIPRLNECVILGSVIALIQDSSGEFRTFRMILDSGSQFSFITAECASKLGLSLNRFQGSISGIGRVALDSHSPKGIVDCTIRSTVNDGTFFHTKAVVLPNITNDLPQSPFPASWRTKYLNYQLADPYYWRPGPVDFLLGGDLFFDILEGKPIHIAPNLPKLTPTAFGFVIGGRLQRPMRQHYSTSLFTRHDNELSRIMNKFWSVEEVEEKFITSPDDEFCELHFQRNYDRTSSGRYIVALPFREPPSNLVSSRSAAMIRFRNLECKFARNPDFKQAYIQFMEEYAHLNHMKVSNDPAAYTIPHHAVFKSDGVRSKIRVVFDGSYRTSQGSLNDFLLPGPKLQKDIGTVILRFRLHRFVFTADIVKMFRQVLIRDEDLKYQHILWRSDPTEKLQDFTLNTITYGTTSAPWLAIRTLIQLVKDEGDAYPEAARVILNDTYVDDICSGASTLQGALDLKSQLIELLRKGQFELSKWSSNDPTFLETTLNPSESGLLQLGSEDQIIKVLGLQWDSNKDHFTYQIEVPSLISTKRSILSSIARVFDPLGYLSPVVCYAKIILQLCWQAQVDWDQNVPDSIAIKWKRFVEQLPLLDRIAIPRFIPASDASSLQIVGFCDASEQAYSAMIYLRSVSPMGTKISLLKAKSKLAPLKPLSVPRLELSAALLLSRLLSSLKDFLASLTVSKYYWFSDSMVVLGWLRAEPSALKTFVAHRVVEIVDTTNSADWYHVRTAENPADCASRGLLPADFIGHPLWTSGPSWLHLPIEEWPIDPLPALKDVILPEMKDTAVSYLVSRHPGSVLVPWMERFSSFSRLVRVTAYIVRFLRNFVGWPTGEHRIKSNKTMMSLSELLKNVPPVSAPEYKFATTLLIKVVQSNHLPLKGCTLDQSKLCGSLQKLNLFIAHDGVVRVGGRLSNFNLPKNVIHPILLPGKCHFTRILIDHYHKINLHVGPSSLQCILQNQFWITSARLVVKQRVHRCATCYKLSKEPKAPYMGDLPKCRFQGDRAFQEVGVDLAGPFHIRESLRRKASLGKAYLCLFICMTSKAVHLEVVSSCSTPAFLAALDRFISRRGCPSRIHSDCGSNFIGANREMREILQWYRQLDTSDAIIDHLTPRGIEWSFNPPASPHFGGLWEAAIKSSKSIFKRIAGNTPLSFEELSTFFTRIEAILNSRPLCPLNNDPESLAALTPGHLLIGTPLSARPELPLMHLPENRLSRWQLVQQRTQHFWKRFKSEYLHHLQQRNKWTKRHPNVEIGDLVIIKANSDPANWILGRIKEVFPGKDGVLRVAEIRTAHGTLVRPVTKLVSLRPITDPEPAPVPLPES